MRVKLKNKKKKILIKWQLSFVLEFDIIKSEGCWLKIKMFYKQVKVNFINIEKNYREKKKIFFVEKSWRVKREKNGGSLTPGV